VNERGQINLKYQMDRCNADIGFSKRNSDRLQMAY
jgi:hypothetical protein